jgi:succinate dehydrogenase/fumarate reductase flavoprotein subunit
MFLPARTYREVEEKPTPDAARLGRNDPSEILPNPRATSRYASSMGDREVRSAREISSWHRDVDVLVVGLGCAGAAAALDATKCGADVVVIERASGGGGTSSMSGGVIYLGGGTQLQKDCGFEDSPEDMYKYLMASCGENPDEAKISVYCEQSVEHYQWFLDHNVPFNAVYYAGYSGEPPTSDGLVFSGNENVWPYNEIAKPAPRGHVPATPNQTGWLLMQKLIEAIEKSRAEMLTDTRAQALVVDDDGAVVGAVTKRDGAEFAVRTRRGVVLTAGGFINDKNMLATYAPTLRRCMFRVGAEGDDGSGIRLGIGVGAAAVNMGMGSISLPISPPKNLTKGILVNAQGQRFINEDAYMGALGEHALLHHDGKAYLIVDGETFEKPDVEREVAGVGETIEELENAIGLPEGSLIATLDLYNKHAERGEDPLYHKGPDYVAPLKPPYAAFDCTTENSLYAAFTLGGLQTNREGQVLTAGRDVIPGLYGAGRTTACLAAPGYSSGLSIGDGTFFGRRAGRHAATGAA